MALKKKLTIVIYADANDECRDALKFIKDNHLTERFDISVVDCDRFGILIGENIFWGKESFYILREISSSS